MPLRLFCKLRLNRSDLEIHHPQLCFGGTECGDTLPSSHRRGENGHAELTAEGLGDALLALFDKMVRSLDEARIRSFVADIIG